ncbi:hypothetical protein EDB83DRAFT_2312488 [Lactarius deliciosus]|nr:hypothetical protein EDB83DRAFT_2312488 [Lactarius deliciosus]
MPPFVTSHDLASTERRSIMIAHLRTPLLVETSSGLQLIVGDSPLRRKNASRSSTRGMQRGVHLLNPCQHEKDGDCKQEGANEGGRTKRHCRGRRWVVIGVTLAESAAAAAVVVRVMVGVGHYRHPGTGVCHCTPHDDEAIQMASTKAPKKVPGTARRQLLQMWCAGATMKANLDEDHPN